MVLGGIQGILHEGNSIGTGLEHLLPFFGDKVDEERHLLEDGIEGGLDGLDIGGREGCVDVLVWSGGLLGLGLVFVRLWVGLAGKQSLVECSFLTKALITCEHKAWVW
uniref:Uncharacterized protein n=1 Tax=Candidatus Kentrum sp. DK TaxID=2126562 RepID=A0A450TKU0_9GAMM|nr:MAG: hypothetical protein BECKDK2373B_GA0170837_120912 [Candidatus Kentron sp. DK]